MKILQRKTLITIAAVVLIPFNLFYMYVYIMKNLSQLDPMFAQPGFQFANFQEELKGVKRVGFLTNKNITREDNDGHYLQAQFILAPTILELNNNNHEFLILDYTHQYFVFYMIKTLNLKPIDDTGYMKVLAVYKDQ
ncbi:MAG: hypothetical protein KC713_03350 [Candidatus Omnitrophica bacterium]|nr:hypothetical protein [Candidatus Omnitrophota bacterium]